MSTLPEIYDDMGNILYKLPKQGIKNLPSTLVFSLPKAGSVMLNECVKAMCALAGVTYVDLPGFMFSNGISLDEFGRFSPVLQDYGYCYGGFRRIPKEIPTSFMKSCQKIVLVRDPRDVLVSSYYSIRNSHPLPGNKSGEYVRADFINWRERAMSQNVDEYVLENSCTYVEMFGEYLELLGVENCNLVKYEDIIYDKILLLSKINDMFKWEISSEKLAEIVKSVDVVPDSEDVLSHVRQVHPGNHKVKLKKSTIGKLNGIFRDILNSLNYDEDPVWVRPIAKQTVGKGEENLKYPEGYWFYAVEVGGENYTPGGKFQNVALTRNLLQAVDLTGAYCLDIGTMEGLIPVLMAKRAARVVATDALNFSAKIEFVKRLHGVEFEYHGNVQIDDVVPFINEKLRFERFGTGTSRERFDVVVASAMLHRVFSPLHLIGYARSLVRPGGIVIFETAALLTPTFTQQYNYMGGRYIYGWTDTWFLSVPLLDYLVRFCKMAPLDCVYFRQGNDGLARVAVACRAVETVITDEAETIMEMSTRNFDYASIVADDPPGPRLPDVPYQGGRDGLVFRPATGTCDLFASCSAMPPYEPTEDEVVLRLGAMY